MRILVTNDDGIGADGLFRLVRAAICHGEVWVVAPDGQRSASSHSINLTEPLMINEYNGFDDNVSGVIHAYSCSGTPADCVRVGVLGIMPEKPDVVLSGINYGYNAATDIQYSGTLGAAFEAAFQGCHAVAFSESADPVHETADRYLDELLAEALDMKLSYGQVININFPHGALSGCKGVLRDRRVSRGMFYKDGYREVKELGVDGTRFKVDGKWTAIGEEGTDLKAITDGYVSVGIVNNIS